MSQSLRVLLQPSKSFCGWNRLTWTTKVCSRAETLPRQHRIPAICIYKESPNKSPSSITIIETRITHNHSTPTSTCISAASSTSNNPIHFLQPRQERAAGSKSQQQSDDFGQHWCHDQVLWTALMSWKAMQLTLSAPTDGLYVMMRHFHSAQCHVFHKSLSPTKINAMTNSSVSQESLWVTYTISMRWPKPYTWSIPIGYYPHPKRL